MKPTWTKQLHAELDRIEGEVDEVNAERQALLSAIKTHRNATESRVKLMDSRNEARNLIKSDRDLYEIAERIEAP